MIYFPIIFLCCFRLWGESLAREEEIHVAVSATLLTIAHAPKFYTSRKLFTITWTTTALRQIRNCDVNWTRHVSGAEPHVQKYIRQDTSSHSDDELITHQKIPEAWPKSQAASWTFRPQEVRGQLPLVRTLLGLLPKAKEKTWIFLYLDQILTTLGSKAFAFSTHIDNHFRTLKKISQFFKTISLHLAYDTVISLYHKLR